MKDDETSTEEERKLAERRKRQMGKARGGLGTTGMIAFVLLILIASPFIILGPQGVSEFLGLQTSDTEELQTASKVDTGISTALPTPDGPITKQAPEFEVTPLKPVERDLNEAELNRIAELEAQLKALQDQPKEQGISADQLTKLLEAQAATLRDEAQRAQEARDQQLQQLMAKLRTDLAPKGPTPEEIAELERLQRIREAEERDRLRQQQLEDEARARAEARQEELRAEAEQRRQAAAELRAKQLDSQSLIFDESEEGASAPGSDDDQHAEDVRELSSNEAFLSSSATARFETSKAKRLDDLSQTIVQGTIITATLETAINTELPGNIRAQVIEPVFSYDGERVLMPAGTRLIGTFNSEIGTAQTRVLIAWNRAITPEGLSINIGSTGTDRLGRTGTTGNLDRRFVERFGTAILITAISAIPSFLSSESENSSVEAANSVANDASGDLAEQTESVLEDYLSLPPIIRVPQGEDIRVFVNRDLVF
ncbi:MAG: TrbI/VirB10 family protein [Pseudomonadota bacterium]